MQLESRLQRLENEVANNFSLDNEEYPLNSEERRQYLHLLIKWYNEEPLTQEEHDQIAFFRSKTKDYSSRHPFGTLLTSDERRRCIDLLVKYASEEASPSEIDEYKNLISKSEGV